MLDVTPKIILLHGINQPAFQVTKILNSHPKIWIVT